MKLCLPLFIGINNFKIDMLQIRLNPKNFLIQIRRIMKKRAMSSNKKQQIKIIIYLIKTLLPFSIKKMRSKLWNWKILHMQMKKEKGYKNKLKMKKKEFKMVHMTMKRTIKIINRVLTQFHCKQSDIMKIKWILAQTNLRFIDIY